MARRQVDDEALDLSLRHRLEVLGDRLDVPAWNERLGLDVRPSLLDEGDEATPRPLGPDALEGAASEPRVERGSPSR